MLLLALLLLLPLLLLKGACDTRAPVLTGAGATCRDPASVGAALVQAPPLVSNPAGQVLALVLVLPLALDLLLSRTRIFWPFSRHALVPGSLVLVNQIRA